VQCYISRLKLNSAQKSSYDLHFASRLVYSTSGQQWLVDNSTTKPWPDLAKFILPKFISPFPYIYVKKHLYYILYTEISTFSFSNIFFFILGRKRIVFNFYSRRNWSVFIFSYAGERKPKSIRFQFFQKDLFSKMRRFQIEAFSCTIRERTLIFSRRYQIQTISNLLDTISPKIKKCPRMSVWHVYARNKKWRPFEPYV